MSKGKKIGYWVATVWLALGMVSTGVVQLMGVKEEEELFINLGYPLYLLAFLGVSKLLGTVAVLMPKFPVLKEWAYAGFFFTMVGAVYSHIAVGDGFVLIAPPLLLLVLTVVSWWLRPASRKVISTN